MKQDAKELSEILSLVTALRENTILSEHLSRLDEILSTNPKTRECYTEIIRLHVDMEFMFKQNAITIPFPGDN